MENLQVYCGLEARGCTTEPPQPGRHSGADFPGGMRARIRDRHPKCSNGVVLRLDGNWRWITGNMGNASPRALSYNTTYYALGWTSYATAKSPASPTTSPAAE